MTPFRTASDEGAATAEDLRRCATGDRDALARLYDATAARVYGLVLRTLGDPVRAQQVTRETYLDVWSQAHRYDPAHGSASTWITCLAHRRAIDRVRAEAPGAPDPAADPESETPPDVRAAGLDLSAQQVQALDLTYFRGSTCRQAAEILGVPPGTLTSLLRQGLLRLRDPHAPAA